MARFKMTDEVASVLFDVKNGMLYWSNSEAVYEPVRGRRAGSLSNGYKVTSAMGHSYATADLVHLIENGEWPAYEDMINGLAVLNARFKKHARKPMTEEQADVLNERMEIIERELQERYENF